MSNPRVIVIPAGEHAGPRFPTTPSVHPTVLPPASGAAPARRGYVAGVASAVSGFVTGGWGVLLVVLGSAIAGTSSGLGRGVIGLLYVVVSVIAIGSFAVTMAFASHAFRRNARRGVLWAVLGTALGVLGVAAGAAVIFA